MNIIMITGASSGIGKEFAVQMDRSFSNIHEFWLIARDEKKLNRLADSLCHKTRVFPMDITESGNIRKLEEELVRTGAIIRILIQSAGFGIMGSFDTPDTKIIKSMIQVNCVALTEIIHRMIPFMKKNSRILHLASSAAFLPQPDFAVYAATKAYVLSLSRAINKELERKGIHVTAVCPGPVNTPFFDISTQYTNHTLTIKKYATVQPEQVVSLALRDSYHKKSISVCSIPIKALLLASKLFPHDFILVMMDLIKRKG